ncbi:MAG: restriction endonuclease subunit S, partial [Atopobiaceae bacterium]|nr:restriction endonuclease subunit S [Atopobiaceae bacterium]
MSRLRGLIDELCPDGVTYRALSELFDIRNGYTPSKKNPAFWDGGTHPWFVMEDIRRDGTVLNDSSAHITDKAIKKGLFPANSIIVATSATIGVHALVTVDFLCNQRFTCMTVKEGYADILDVRYA